MHVVVLTAHLRAPADDPSVVGTVHRMLTETRGFAGCVGVETLVDLKDPQTITIIERWGSKDASRAYQTWRRGDGAAGAEAFGALLDGRPSMAAATPAPEL